METEVGQVPGKRCVLIGSLTAQRRKIHGVQGITRGFVYRQHVLEPRGGVVRPSASGNQHAAARGLELGTRLGSGVFWSPVI